MSNLQRSLSVFLLFVYAKHSARVMGAHVSDVGGGFSPLCEREPAGEMALSGA